MSLDKGRDKGSYDTTKLKTDLVKEDVKTILKGSNCLDLEETLP